ncbi:MAG: hypothetical protein IPK80_02440 [Nannocystis sp.]|nr:hypothetical protein [Nannocystis sp.]
MTAARTLTDADVEAIAQRLAEITLLEVDGARESVTRRWTHTAHDEVRDARRGYVRHSWADECREMARLVVPRVGSPRKVGGE